MLRNTHHAIETCPAGGYLTESLCATVRLHCAPGKERRKVILEKKMLTRGCKYTLCIPRAVNSAVRSRDGAFRAVRKPPRMILKTARCARLGDLMGDSRTLFCDQLISIHALLIFRWTPKQSQRPSHYPSTKDNCLSKGNTRGTFFEAWTATSETFTHFRFILSLFVPEQFRKCCLLYSASTAPNAKNGLEPRTG